MTTIAVAIVCKTPTAGQSKTRLSPPLRPEECAAISGCFIRDLSGTIGQFAAGPSVVGYAVYTPSGSEHLLRPLLPDHFGLMAQSDGDLGQRCVAAIAGLFGAGHSGAILVNSDSPTLPAQVLRQAINAVRRGAGVVLSPALDGGYTLIGLPRPEPRLFVDIPWSTADVFRVTLERAAEHGLAVTQVPGWYDVDDAASFQMLEAEFSGVAPPCATGGLVGAAAPATRQFILDRRAARAAQQ